MAKRIIKNCVINGRRWFDRTYGNTYHTVSVYVNEEHLGVSPITYGYGDSFIQTAYEMIKAAGYFPKTADHWEMEQYKRNNRDKFVIEYSDVSRKKDL